MRITRIVGQHLQHFPSPLIPIGRRAPQNVLSIIVRAPAARTSLFPQIHFVLMAVCWDDVVDILHKVDPPLYLLSSKRYHALAN